MQYNSRARRKKNKRMQFLMRKTEIWNLTENLTKTLNFQGRKMIFNHVFSF